MIPIKIVVPDGYTLNPGDLDWSALHTLGDTFIYDHSTPEALVERAQDADIVLANKVKLGADILAQLPSLKLIAVTATGYNNIDIAAARQRGIAVCNVSGYGTTAVAQHVFSLLLEMTNRVYEHHLSVQAGDWSRCRDFCYTLSPIIELEGRTMGIYGFGRIGRQVALLAQAFGMHVLATHKHPERDAMPGVEFVSLPTLFSASDVVSLHAPLTEENRGIVNEALLRTMRPGAMLINTGRGDLIAEQDLRRVLDEGWLGGAALDVLSQEPPPADHPLIGAPRCLITPHNAWAGQQARRRLLHETILNIRAFLAGEARNSVA